MPDLQADYGSETIIRILGWEDNMQIAREDPDGFEEHFQARLDAINNRYWETEGEDDA